MRRVILAMGLTLVLLSGCNPTSPITDARVVVQVKECSRDWNSSQVYEMSKSDLDVWIWENESSWTFKGVRYTELSSGEVWNEYKTYDWVSLKDC